MSYARIRVVYERFFVYYERIFVDYERNYKKQPQSLFLSFKKAHLPN